MKRLYIFDCDGVLVDSSARYRVQHCPIKGKPVIDLDHWRENTCRAMETDKLLPMAEFYQNALYNDADSFVVIATARAMLPNDAEMRHICEVLGKPQVLIYRKPNDQRGGAALKIAGIRKLLNLRQFAGCKIEVFEDNISYLRDIVDTLRNLGYDVIGHYIPSNQGH